MDKIPLGLIAELIKAHQFNSEIQLINLLTQIPLMTPTVSPTVTPPCAPPTPASDVSEPLEPSDPPEEPLAMITVATVPKKRRSPMSPTKVSGDRNTYSDCEKKHFLDVAYENNWGTTVAANKFSRIWGKGPTRRMFYWWREQFKRDHDRDHRTLKALTDRKTELTKELSGFCYNQEKLLLPTNAERAKQCLTQMEAVDSEIEIFHAKKLKVFCSITGEKCTHGDGLQEESPAARKFTTPYICEHCKMPFQKETTCSTHQKLCETRFVSQIVVDPPKTFKIEQLNPLELPQPSPPAFDGYNNNLTDLAEHLIAKIAASTQTTVALN